MWCLSWELEIHQPGWVTHMEIFPMPSMPASMTSFATRLPTPTGVPVNIRSPGNSVTERDNIEINSDTENNKSEICACCRMLPLTLSQIALELGELQCAAETMAEQGAEKSKALAGSHELPFFLAACCKSLRVKSSPTA